MHQLVLIKSHSEEYAQQYEQKLGEEILLSLILNWKCKVYVQILSVREIFRCIDQGYSTKNSWRGCTAQNFKE